MRDLYLLENHPSFSKQDDFNTPGDSRFGSQAKQSIPGRRAELSALFRSYQEASHGERLVLVSGPAGVGKTRLLRGFRNELRLHGGITLEGRCETGVAFGPFAAIVESARSFLSEMGASTPLSSHLGCSHRCHALWYEHPEHLAHDEPLTTNAEDRRLRFFDAIRELFQEVARFRTPSILVHELERADEGTLQLLRYLVESAGPWSASEREDGLSALFVASIEMSEHMPAATRRQVNALSASAAVSELKLQPLDAQGIAEFFQDPAVLKRLIAKTGGLPSALDRLIASPIISSSQRLTRRLETLEPSIREQLAALAVLGRPVPAPILESIVDSVVRPDALMASGLIAQTRVRGETRYGIERATHRRLLVEALEESARLELHSKCAEVFAERGGGGLAAEHALLAGDTDLAMRYALIEAEGLAGRHAHADAAALLDRVIDAAKEIPDAAIRRAVELYSVAGDYRRATHYAHLLRERYPSSARDALRLGRLLTESGDPRAAEEVLEKAHALAGAEEAELLAAAEAQLAEIALKQGDFERAQERASHVLEVAHGHDDRRVARTSLQARNVLGKIALSRSDRDLAEIHFETNRSEAERLGMNHETAQALTNLGVSLMGRGDLEGARDRLAEARRLALEARDVALATGNLAAVAHRAQRFDEALIEYKAAFERMKRLGLTDLTCWAAYNLGQLFLMLGEVERAELLADFIEQMGPRSSSDRYVEMLRADALVLQGNAERAVLILRGLVDEEALSGGTRERARVRLLSALIEAERYDEALEQATAAAPTGVQEARVARLYGELKRRQGVAGDELAGLARRAVRLAAKTGDLQEQLHANLLLVGALLSAEESDVAIGTTWRNSVVLREDFASRIPPEHLEAWERTSLLREFRQIEARMMERQPAVLRGSRPPPVLRSAQHDLRYPEIVGTSAPIVRLLGRLDKVAPSEATVLIRGESGTGKELVASALHKHSARRGKPFIKVNCAALVETLLLSELFGHDKGAFTGASSDKKGRFELADGGTLFLDEIGDISPATQVALLRALQEREFERVGGTNTISVNVRIIVATHRDLEAMVRAGTFREDLYYRLRGIELVLPPLRRRREDIGLIAEQILRASEGETKVLARDALTTLRGHDWPGNIRELENVLRTAAIFVDGQVIRAGDLQIVGRSTHKASSDVLTEHLSGAHENPPVKVEEQLYRQLVSDGSTLPELKKMLEKECIIRALSDSDGNITRAAALLGMTRPRLSQLVKKYELQAYKA